MYVINPTVSLLKVLPSYKSWANFIVLDGANPNLLDAACCKVLVLNTSRALLFFSFSVTLSILNDLESLANISSASTSFGISTSLPWYLSNVALNSLKSASIVQYSRGTKAWISLSRSTINFRTTL